ncbi:UDP-glucuronate 4-epimerase 3 [Olea europaea subsp. europaea]|uniref:UDP-glucuronate 4-epimerase 3 n=1 Tax=Olea europaea subsp. europaea TaxID=158383 RepID=A0A8S0RAX8_OLEEU|nr:UDP-glucuronate 4-epimerase 3 [Olea europaea subsp. europaea]
MKHIDNNPSNPGKCKMEKSPYSRLKLHYSLAKLTFWSFVFIGTYVSTTLKHHGDGVLGLDNFNDYYDPSLKRARQAHLERPGVYIVEGDINDVILLKKLFNIVPFTHVMHLAAQAGVRYAMENPSSYVHSNIAGLVSVLEICKSVNPQPAILWASSSSVFDGVGGDRFWFDGGGDDDGLLSNLCEMGCCGWPTGGGGRVSTLLALIFLCHYWNCAFNQRQLNGYLCGVC